MSPTAKSLRELVEEQVHRWSQEETRRGGEPQTRWPVITISREFGSLGAAVGRRVADLLGFSFWDKELVQAITEETGARAALTATLDEAAMTGLDELMHDVLLGAPGTQREYLRQLVRIVSTIERHGGAVIVGRGAAFIVGEESLNARVVSPVATRVAGYAERARVDLKEATRAVRQLDTDRARFIKTNFDRDGNDPTFYDITVNTGRSTVDEAARMIVQAYRIQVGRLPARPE